MLFWPAPIDKSALAHFATADDGRPVSFWLVDEDDPDAELRHGHPLEYMQLCTLERLIDLPMAQRSSLDQQASPEREWAFR